MKIRSENISSKHRGQATRPFQVTASFLVSLLVATLHSAGPGPPARNLGDLSIEELMNETITSVSKHEEKLGDAAAAIAVLSNDDLRRSGATTIMEALRLVPGVNVGQVNSSRWAISARGFNSVFSSKLLVLVDGRAIYTPLFSGVFWDLQQVMLEDVDRIEVIRGPGATVWGANAVNGVINVVSRSARETTGVLLSAGGGDQHRRMGSVRYGAQVGANTFYRVFASERKDADFPLAGGVAAADGWAGRQAGFRVDHYPAADTHLTWLAGATGVTLDDDSSDSYTYNTLGRWTRQLADRSAVEVQAYVDRLSRHEAAQADVHSDTVDVAAHHTFGIGARHNIIWGGGYRYVDSRLAPTTPLIQVRSARSRQQLFSAFLQDEIQFVPNRLTLSVGGKLEHNDYTGWEFQPSIRAVFKPTPESTLWAAVSRAVRTPSAIEGKDTLGITAGAPFRGPDGGAYLPTIVGNRQLVAEVLRAFEIGFRVQVSRQLSADLTLFANRYSELTGYRDVRRLVPGVPFGLAEIPFENQRGGDTYGGELSVTMSPVDTWRVTASYARLEERIEGARNTNIPSAPTSPRHQGVLRSSYDFTPQISLNVQLRHVSAVSTIPGYTTGDFRLAYRWTDALELSLVGQNLFDPQHAEQGPQQSTVTAEVPRAYYGKVTWRF